MPNSSFYRLLRTKDHMQHVHVFYAMMGCGKTYVQKALSDLVAMAGFRSIASVIDSDDLRLSDPVALTAYIDSVARDAWSPETILFTNNWRAAQYLVSDGAYLHSAIAWGVTAVDVARRVIEERGSDPSNYRFEEWIKSPGLRDFLDAASNPSRCACEITQSSNLYRLDLAPEWPIVKQHIVSIAERNAVASMMLDRALRLLLTFIKNREAIAASQTFIADRIINILEFNQMRPAGWHPNLEENNHG